MSLKIYNSLTKQKEEFVPITPGRVGMYVCGPTVYGKPHVGHARSYINFDVVRRYLEFCGYKVKYVQNITDVGHLTGDTDAGEDKILKQAKKEELDPYEIAYKYEVLYFDAMDKLNILRPSISARATAFIPEMIEMVQKILDKGYAYVTDNGNVYFSVRKYDKYGQLSNRTLDKTKSGERIEVADDKQYPEDFALWKKAENGHIMKWNSPWSVGYPGWHLECSTMSKKFLGDTFDIHGGGIDNMFPHHECEFAQSEVANGVPFVHYFMHNNLITVNGTKMGKSLNNFTTLEDLFTRHDPMYVRYFILQFGYRSPIDFNEDGLNSAANMFTSLQTSVNNMREITTEQAPVQANDIKEIYDNMINALNDDFNTPIVISEVLRLQKLINVAVNANDVAKLSQLNTVVSNICEQVLGLKFVKPASDDNTQFLLDFIGDIRTELRKEKNYALSDKIRDTLLQKGIKQNDKKL